MVIAICRGYLDANRLVPINIHCIEDSDQHLVEETIGKVNGVSNWLKLVPLYVVTAVAESCARNVNMSTAGCHVHGCDNLRQYIADYHFITTDRLAKSVVAAETRLRDHDNGIVQFHHKKKVSERVVISRKDLMKELDAAEMKWNEFVRGIADNCVELAKYVEIGVDDVVADFDATLETVRRRTKQAEAETAKRRELGIEPKHKGVRRRRSTATPLTTRCPECNGNADECEC